MGATRDTMITVGFNEPLDIGGDAITSYRIKWDRDPSMNSLYEWPHKGSVAVNSADDQSYTITDLTPGIRYYVQVQAGNLVGYGTPQTPTPAWIEPSNQVPGLPTTLSLNNQTDTAGTLEVVVNRPRVPAHEIYCGGGGTVQTLPTNCPLGMGRNYTADGGDPINQFEIQYSDDPSFSGTVNTAVLPIRDHEAEPFYITLTGLFAHTEYYVRVAARNGQGIGEFCGNGGLLCDGDTLFSQPKAAS